MGVVTTWRCVDFPTCFHSGHDDCFFLPMHCTLFTLTALGIGTEKDHGGGSANQAGASCRICTSVCTGFYGIHDNEGNRNGAMHGSTRDTHWQQCMTHDRGDSWLSRIRLYETDDVGSREAQ